MGENCSNFVLVNKDIKTQTQMRTIKKITEMEQISPSELNLLSGGSSENKSSDGFEYIIINGKMYIITPTGLKPFEEVI